MAATADGEVEGVLGGVGENLGDRVGGLRVEDGALDAEGGGRASAGWVGLVGHKCFVEKCSILM